MNQRLPVYPDAQAGLPPLHIVDQLDANALIDLATTAAALHARAMARLAYLQKTPPRDEDEYIDAAEIACLLDVSSPYVYELIRSGGLPAVAFGKYRRVRRADFRAWANRHRVDVPEYLAHRPRDRARGMSTANKTAPEDLPAEPHGRKKARVGQRARHRRDQAPAYDETRDVPLSPGP